MFSNIIIAIFNHTTNNGFTINDLHLILNDKRIHAKTIEKAISRLINHGLIAYNSQSKKYYLLDYSAQTLYDLLNINYTVESTISLSDSSTGYVYAYYYDTYKQLAFMNEIDSFPVKIGYTSQKYPLLRIKEQLSTSTPETPIVGLLISSDNAQKLEKMIHQWYKYHNKHINVDYNNEWFLTNIPELTTLINQLAKS